MMEVDLIGAIHKAAKKFWEHETFVAPEEQGGYKVTITTVEILKLQDPWGKLSLGPKMVKLGSVSWFSEEEHYAFRYDMATGEVKIIMAEDVHDGPHLQEDPDDSSGQNLKRWIAENNDHQVFGFVSMEGQITIILGER